MGKLREVPRGLLQGKCPCQCHLATQVQVRPARFYQWGTKQMCRGFHHRVFQMCQRQLSQT